MIQTQILYMTMFKTTIKKISKRLYTMIPFFNFLFFLYITSILLKSEYLLNYSLTKPFAMSICRKGEENLIG